MLRPSTAGNTPMRCFSNFFLMMVFLLITRGLKFSKHASWTESSVSHMLFCVEPSFLESSVSFEVTGV